MSAQIVPHVPLVIMNLPHVELLIEFARHADNVWMVNIKCVHALQQRIKHVPVALFARRVNTKLLLVTQPAIVNAQIALHADQVKLRCPLVLQLLIVSVALALSAKMASMRLHLALTSLIVNAKDAATALPMNKFFPRAMLPMMSCAFLAQSAQIVTPSLIHTWITMDSTAHVTKGTLNKILTPVLCAFLPLVAQIVNHVSSTAQCHATAMMIRSAITAAEERMSVLMEIPLPTPVIQLPTLE